MRHSAVYASWRTFDEVPIEEVRRACLETIKKQGHHDLEWAARWFEDRISASRGDEALSTAYLYMCRPFTMDAIPYAVRAVEFLVKQIDERPSRAFRREDTSKWIFGFLKDWPDSYWRSMVLRKYVESLLEPLVPTDRHPNQRYEQYPWEAAKRVLRFAANVGDTSLLPLIQAIHEGHVAMYQEFEEGDEAPSKTSWPYSDDEGGYAPFELGMHAACVRNAFEILKRMKRRMSGDMGIKLGALLKRETGLELDPCVRIEYPEVSTCMPGARTRVKAMVFLRRVPYTSHEESKAQDERIDRVFADLFFGCHFGSGSRVAKYDGIMHLQTESPALVRAGDDQRLRVTPVRYVFEDYETPEGYSPAGFIGVFSMELSRGVNRLRVSLDRLTYEKWGEQYLGTHMCYMRCE